MYSRDYSNCCHNRLTTVTRKRKLSASDDKDFCIEDELKAVKVHKNSANKDSSTNEDNLWKPDGEEEEEVVCAPDLSLLMDEDDGTEAPLQFAAPNNISSNNIRLVGPISHTIPKPIILQRSSTKARPMVFSHPPVIVNHTAAGSSVGLKSPILSHSLTTATPSNQSKSVIPFLPSLSPLTTHNVAVSSSSADTSTPKLMPGLKHEWFESAARATAKAHTKLSFEISVLSKDQSSASTIEQLAKVHNRLQEVLSASINSLIQVRRNLRTEFLAGLNKLKFSRSNNVQTGNKSVGFGNSPIIKKQSISAAPVTETIDLVSNTQSEEPVNRPRTYLKVRTVDELLNIPSECITIPDDNEKDRETTSSPVVKEVETCENAKTGSNTNNSTEICDTLENSDSNKENLENFSRDKKICDESEAVVSQDENEPITHEIKRALFESKMEKMINDNLQYNCNGISLNDLKYMLSARVYVNVKREKTPCERNPCAMEDFEAMLNGSVVIKPQYCGP